MLFPYQSHYSSKEGFISSDSQEGIQHLSTSIVEIPAHEKPLLQNWPLQRRIIVAELSNMFGEIAKHAHEEMVLLQNS